MSDQDAEIQYALVDKGMKVIIGQNQDGSYFGEAIDQLMDERDEYKAAVEKALKVLTDRSLRSPLARVRASNILADRLLKGSQ